MMPVFDTALPTSLERLRKYEEALEQYARALKLDPTMAKAWFNRGDIYKFQGKYADSILSYQQGLQIEPDNSRARKNLTEALAAAQDR